MTACKKAGLALPDNSGCIERVLVPVNVHTISSSDMASANTLFAKNNMDNSRLRYYQYFRDSTQTFFPPYAKFENEVVKADEYTNGLRIFTGQLVFAFKNGVFNFRSGTPTNGTSLNTTPTLRLGQLRKLFLDNAEQFERKGSQYGDSCLKAEFGYYNLNAGTSYAAENLIKAWRVTMKHSLYPSEYPQAFYQDNDGQLIYYANGIQTFK